MRSLFFMGSTTAIRLTFGLLSFSIMARYLGPDDFGKTMMALAASILVGLLPNFGFANYALREIGIDQGSFGKILSDLVAAKILLFIPTAAVCVSGALYFNSEASTIFLIFSLAQVADAFTELLNVGFRATGRYSTETRITTIAAMGQCLIILAMLWIWPTALAAATGYVVARWLVLFFTYASQSKLFSVLRWSGWEPAITRIKAARTFALDYSLQSLFGQVDSLLLVPYAGTIGVGIYQAGMRVFQGAAQSASVLGNVFIPALSAAFAGSADILKSSFRMQIGFMGIGFVVAILLIVGARPIVQSVYGDGYADLIPLFPLFGLLFYVRFVAAAWGVILTASGHQKLRAAASAIQWCVLLSLAPIVLPQSRVAGWLWLLIATNVGLAIAYLFSLQVKRVKAGPQWFAACTLLGVLLVAILKSP